MSNIHKKININKWFWNKYLWIQNTDNKQNSHNELHIYQHCSTICFHLNGRNQKKKKKFSNGIDEKNDLTVEYKTSRPNGNAK